MALWVLAVLFLAIVLGYGILGASFLARTLGTVLGTELPNTSSIATFNLEKLQAILKEKGQLPPEGSGGPSRP